MEEKKKKKGGNDYLKEKIAKLETELKTEVFEHQALEEKYDKDFRAYRSMLKDEKDAHEADVKRLSAMADDLMHYMGWLRRWIWVTFRAEKFVD